MSTVADSIPLKKMLTCGAGRSTPQAGCTPKEVSVVYHCYLSSLPLLFKMKTEFLAEYGKIGDPFGFPFQGFLPF
jgi:hypothetical protein